MQPTCDNELVQAINDHLPEGTRPVTTLASPGEINRSVVRIMAEKIPADKVAGMVLEMLEATRITKAGEVPDWRAREAAMKIYYSYIEGLPIQRQEIHQTVTNKSDEESMRVLQSPAMMRAMLAMMSKTPEGREVIGEVVEKIKP